MKFKIPIAASQKMFSFILEDDVNVMITGRCIFLMLEFDHVLKFGSGSTIVDV